MARNRFDSQLECLNDQLVEMGKLIEWAIATAVTALAELSSQDAQRVVAFDDEIDRKEKDIENLCLKLLLQQQPVARDLRLISSALKMITDMERIGDQAADISELVLLMDGIPSAARLEDIVRMGMATIKMVTDSIDAFVKRDLELARSVIEYDDVVDDLFVKVRGELIGLIRENVISSEQIIDMLMIAKYLERIGDHATNIAEWVEFAITGEHKSSQKSLGKPFDQEQENDPRQESGGEQA